MKKLIIYFLTSVSALAAISEKPISGKPLITTLTTNDSILVLQADGTTNPPLKQIKISPMLTGITTNVLVFPGGATLTNANSSVNLVLSGVGVGLGINKLPSVAIDAVGTINASSGSVTADGSLRGGATYRIFHNARSGFSSPADNYESVTGSNLTNFLAWLFGTTDPTKTNYPAIYTTCQPTGGIPAISIVAANGTNECNLNVSGDVRLQKQDVPSATNSVASGPGIIRVSPTGDYLYVSVGTNSWKRAALNAW